MDTLTVLDTDVFIDHFRGLAAATAYIQGLHVAQRATTDVTVMELYKGAVNREQLTTIVRFLGHNHVTRLAGVSRRIAACGDPPARLQSRPWPWDPRCTDRRDCPGRGAHPGDQQSPPFSVYRWLTPGTGAVSASSI